MRRIIVGAFVSLDGVMQAPGGPEEDLLAHDLVDELRVLTFPIVLGPGKRLFGQDAKATGLRLESSKVSPNGVVITSYARAGEVKTGSFALEDPTADEIERRKNLR